MFTNWANEVWSSQLNSRHSQRSAYYSLSQARNINNFDINTHTFSFSLSLTLTLPPYLMHTHTTFFMWISHLIRYFNVLFMLLLWLFFLWYCQMCTDRLTAVIMLFTVDCYFVCLLICFLFSTILHYFLLFDSSPDISFSPPFYFAQRKTITGFVFMGILRIFFITPK